MLAIGFLAPATVSVAPSADDAASKSAAPPPATGPSSRQSLWTQTLRAGPTIFAAAGPGGNCEGCWVPVGAIYPATGLRLDYVLQKGTSNLRWHNLLSLELGWGTRSAPGTHQCTSDPTGNCNETDISTVPAAAVFVGTGFRIDTDPSGPSACILELDGTIGASTAPDVGLLGLHWAMGARFAARWEVLASVEADVFAYVHASASVVFGRSL